MEGAIRELREARELDPERADIHAMLGVAYKRKGELPLGVTFLEDALRLDSKLLLGHHHLAMAQAR